MRMRGAAKSDRIAAFDRMDGRLMNVAGGAMDERTPLCINTQEDEDIISHSRSRTSIQHRRIAPLPTRPRTRERATVGGARAGYDDDDDCENGKRTNYNTLTNHPITSSLELSVSSEFISIEISDQFSDMIRELITQSPFFAVPNVDFLTIDIVAITTSGCSGSDVTSQALELCEKWALKHYRRVLMALGWMPPQSDCCSPYVRRTLHIALVLFWIVIILGAFIAQILSCFRRDKFLAFHDTKTWHTYNESCSDLNDNINTSNIIPDGDEGSNHTCRTLFCDHHHLFTDYILFDLLLLTVYLYGVYLFRSEDGGDVSYLHNLASRAFVMNSLSCQVSNERSSNRQLLLSIMVSCVAGSMWIFLSLVVRILTISSAGLLDKSVAIRWHDEIFYGGEKVSLVIFSLVGFLFFDMVYMAATLNYAVQSELLVWLLSSVTTLLYKNEYHNIDAAIKDILECRRYLRTLNGRASTSVALIIFIVGNMGILGILTLNQITDYDDDTFKITVAILNIVSWVSLVSLPIIQATRVTRTCLLLKDAVAEIRSRPQLYVNTPQLDLDSLLLLTQAIRLRATIFGVPMSPTFVYGGITITTFVAILLSQSDIYVLSTI